MDERAHPARGRLLVFCAFDERQLSSTRRYFPFVQRSPDAQASDLSVGVTRTVCVQSVAQVERERLGGGPAVEWHALELIALADLFEELR